MSDLGFVIDFRGSKGYIRFIHPELFIEFLVSEKGKGLDQPYPLLQLGINAQALRFLELLAQNILQLKVEGILVNLPHPANFALHKLIIFQKRVKPEKIAKDKETAIKILRALIDKSSQLLLNVFLNPCSLGGRKGLLKGLNLREKENCWRFYSKKLGIQENRGHFGI